MGVRNSPCLRDSTGEIPSRAPASRPRVTGKFLTLGGRKLFVKGVTYGPFAAADSPLEYGAPDRARADLEAIAAHGFNAIRTYTPPPRWLLDVAAETGLLVMIGLAWEQHAAVVDDYRRSKEIVSRVRAFVRQCSGHPA